MTQVGEGHETAADEGGPVLTFGEPTAGEILAERYQLEQHVNDDSAGRQVWRGIDVVLRRPVAVVLRHPGGDSAAEMLQAAVAASRVLHPNLVGVYDAIDEQERAYVVREWVDGESLRDLVAAEGPLDPARAVAIAHSVADALAAVHATGMIHGNVHPGTTLIGDDGRVVLADARADAADSTEADVRAVGGLLYFALTGHWPHAELSASALPDATRDTSGSPAAPRQVRAGVPAYLDDLTMDLLDRRVAAPAAEAITAELSRLDAAAEDEEFEDVGPLRFTQAGGAPSEPGRSTRKILLGVGALVVIAVIGLIFGIQAINDSSKPDATPSTPAQVDPGGQPGDAGTASSAPLGNPVKIPLTADMVRIVDPPQGDRNDEGESKFVVDGDPDTSWKLSYYLQPNFGGRKEGMGVLIHLPQPRALSEVRVSLSAPGAVIDLRVGDKDPGNSRDGDKAIVSSYTKLSDADGADANTGDKQILNGFDPDTKYQYVLVFLTKLPRNEDTPGYQVNVNEIELYGY
ncbi:protein kinase family protein [Actinoplanes cyaneus]|uniref:protein kinase family protein n=1 Tax=Actinoplanes cyaneus TaxID=52696 RepID=UPI001940C986|nr:protein kinase family protein [Actinoplanes cyaneus]MCW2138973.1 Serine/threonine protein kinase [Actinoplanes cyaneus]